MEGSHEQVWFLKDRVGCSVKKRLSRGGWGKTGLGARGNLGRVVR